MHTTFQIVSSLFKWNHKPTPTFLGQIIASLLVHHHQTAIIALKQSPSAALKCVLLFWGSQVEEQRRFPSTLWRRCGCRRVMEPRSPPARLTWWERQAETPALGLVTRAPLSFTLKLYPHTCCHGDALDCKRLSGPQGFKEKTKKKKKKTPTHHCRRTL